MIRREARAEGGTFFFSRNFPVTFLISTTSKNC
jgi:hypothetical protein